VHAVSSPAAAVPTPHVQPPSSRQIFCRHVRKWGRLLRQSRYRSQPLLQYPTQDT
jgi:hypothetical protein